MAENPKDRVATAKVPFSAIPAHVLGEVGLAMMEGARKYGRHNWRETDTYASVYYDAAMRHLTAWWEGENIDPDSGLPHITKAIAGLMVLRDADLSDTLEDDRPLATQTDHHEVLNSVAQRLVEKYPNPPKPVTEKGK